MLTMLNYDCWSLDSRNVCYINLCRVVYSILTRELAWYKEYRVELYVLQRWFFIFVREARMDKKHVLQIFMHTSKIKIIAKYYILNYFYIF